MSSTACDVAILILRLVIGGTLAAHGLNKFFGGGRIPGTARWFDSIGMKSGRLQALAAATTEVSAGLGMVLGLLTPVVAAGFVAVMLVAVWTVHRPHGFFVFKEGWEYNLVLATAAVVVAMVGPHRYSLDRVFFGDNLTGWTGLWIALALGVAGAVGQLALFYRPSTKQAG